MSHTHTRTLRHTHTHRHVSCVRLKALMPTEGSRVLFHFFCVSHKDLTLEIRLITISIIVSYNNCVSCRMCVSVCLCARVCVCVCVCLCVCKWNKIVPIYTPYYTVLRLQFNEINWLYKLLKLTQSGLHWNASYLWKINPLVPRVQE